MRFTSGEILNTPRTEECKDCEKQTNRLVLAKHRGRCKACFDRYDPSFRRDAAVAFGTSLAITGTSGVLYTFRHDSADIDFDPELSVEAILDEAAAAIVDAESGGRNFTPSYAEFHHARDVLTRWLNIYGSNPILDAYRGNLRRPDPSDTVDMTILGITNLWLWYLETGNQEVSDDQFHIDHARHALTRIASHEEAKQADATACDEANS